MSDTNSEIETNLTVLVLGASGMLGNAVFRFFSESNGFVTFGTVRSVSSLLHFEKRLHDKIIAGIDVERTDSLIEVLNHVRPDIVVNCIGVVKQLSKANDVLCSVPINSLLPHKIARLCALVDARLVHMSTDCVFSGDKGNYFENDLPDAQDLYGRSKFLGEVDYPNAITLRTSIIGHELDGKRSLIDWFLSQDTAVRGFKRAVFSGLPTVEIARVVRDFVVANPQLHGLYHVSASPINKYDLLCLVAEVYKKDIQIIPDFDCVIDRSLISDRFRKATGYVAPSWPDLINVMHAFN